MARKVFFSFHFKRDAWRAGQVRNSNLLAKEDEYGVIDAAEWEKIEKEGDGAIERWINGQLQNTSVTAVLIGAQTAERDWIGYEIKKSWERGNAIIGIRIHNVKNHDQETDVAGPNPFDLIKFTDGTTLSSVCKTYDWVTDNGRENLGKWVEESFQERSKYSDKKIDNSSHGTQSTVATSASSGFAPRRPWSAA
jgi:hypothetical protein